MEEEMMMNNDTSPSWKLYENPFYINNNPFKRRMDSELHLARNHILQLQTQLRYERKARKRVESLAKRLLKELNEERKQREGLISSHQAHIHLINKEIQDERKMLRLAEALREERLQMKLAEVKTVFEHMLSQLQSGTTATTTEFSGKLKQTAASSNNNNVVGDGSSPEQSTRLRCNMEIPAVEGRRRASPELENINPHIVRGIKGFVEFRRVVRTGKGLKSRDSDAKLECQMAQLKVLLKPKGTVGSNNLIIT